jgi:hypothetical protein
VAAAQSKTRTGTFFREPCEITRTTPRRSAALCGRAACADANRKQIAASERCRISPVTDEPRVDRPVMRKQNKKLTLAITTVRSLRDVAGVAGGSIISGTTVGTNGATCHQTFLNCYTALSHCPAHC